MIDQLFSLLCLAAIALASYALGRPIIRGLGVGREDRLSSALWSVSAGLIAAGMLLAGLGLVGILHPWLIWALTVAACVWGVAQGISASARRDEEERLPEPEPAGRESRPPRGPWSLPPRWVTGGVLSLAGLACLGSLVAALAPPTAGDALCYHLELPKQFLADHGIRYLPDSENSTYPLLVEMWYLWGLALDGGTTAQLVHWGLGVLLGLATVVLATPVIGRPWAWIAGAAVVLVPGVNNQMTAPLNDVALALMTTLALAAWWQAVVHEQGRRWLLLAGLAAGGALGTKYLALIFAVALAVISLWIFVRKPRKRRRVIEGAAIVATVAASIGGLWYVRAAWHRGNPVYPFLSEVFDGTEPGASGAHETLPESKSPLGRGAWGAVKAPWQVTMHPERFGGRGHQLGVLFLAALPGLLVARRLRGLGTLLGLAAVYWVVWYLLRQNVRFLLPIVPLLSLATIWVWIELRRLPRAPRLVVGATLAAILAASAAVPLVRCRDQVAVAVGRESREDYLLRHEPTYPAADVSNRLLGPEAHLLSQDYRAFYFECPVTRENVYRRRTRYDQKIADPGELSRTLRRRGFTHLLLAENVGDRGAQYDPTLTRLVEAAEWAGGGDSFLKVADYRFADADGGVRRYRLVLLR